jgi:hypothetical protein
MPGGVIDVEAVINEFRTLAIVNLGPYHICQAYLLAANFRK